MQEGHQKPNVLFQKESKTFWEETDVTFATFDRNLASHT